MNSFGWFVEAPTVAKQKKCYFGLKVEYLVHINSGEGSQWTIRKLE